MQLKRTTRAYKEMPKMCQKEVPKRGMQKRCQRDAKEMPKRCQRNVKEMPK